MDSTRKCRGCGAEVPANAPFGHCPNCLLELGFGPLPDGYEDKAAVSPGGGRAFGDYELLEEIGRGGMGIVYKARQKRLKRLVALKMVRAGEFASVQQLHWFHREAEAAASLHHPNIVPIYETGEQDGEHFFSMELIEGSGLDCHITKAGFCFEHKGTGEKEPAHARQQMIARIMAKVARAVEHAHQRAVLHRDLKPSNILLDSAGEPHLTDFGVAKLIRGGGSSLTASGAIMGTPSYMAPEQAAGQGKNATIAADIYSIGATLYEMLTGSPPFRGEGPVETLKQVVEEVPKPPTTLNAGVDRDLATICMKCLDKEPSRRYLSAAALAEDLERWLRNEPILARPTGAMRRAWRWSQRNPKIAALGATVALLLLLIAIGATFTAVLLAAEREVMRQTTIRGLVDFYNDKTMPYYPIPSPTRRALTQSIWSKMGAALRRDPAQGETKELMFGTYDYAHPTNALETFSGVLLDLESKLSARLKRPIAVDMRIFRTYEGLYKSMESGESAFARIGPGSFVYLLDKDVGVSLLAMQEQPLTLAIFTHKDSEIARLIDSQPGAPLRKLLENRSFAFGSVKSTTGSLASKWLLVKEGISATNFAKYFHFANHREVLDAVKSRRFDAGASNLDLVDDHPDLRVITTESLPDLGLCWVASGTVDKEIAKQLQEYLLKLRNPAILGKFESRVVGFKMLDEQAIKRLRAMEAAEKQFSAGDK